MRNLIILAGVLILASCTDKPMKKEESLEEKTERIHAEVITVDTHDDINVRNFTDSINYTQRLNTQINLPKMKEGGLDVAWLIVYTGQDTLTAEGYAKAAENAMAKFEAIHRLCEEIAPDQIELATTSEDVRRIIQSGKRVAMIGVENAYPIGEDMSLFEDYYNRGARYISLSHNGHSQFCDSNTGERDGVWMYNGLSDLGKQAIAEMNRLGIMIDISHVSKESMMQMVALSKAPIIASHSSARALCDHSRNLDDEQLLALKDNGGVVQTVAFSSYLNTEKHEARAEFMRDIYPKAADSLGLPWYQRAQFAELSQEQITNFMNSRAQIRSLADAMAAANENAPEPVNIEDFVNHIDYMVEKIGIDHVGISSDFDGGGGIGGWQDASETLNVTRELVKRGYSEEEIAKLWGGNLLRVLDEVGKVAASL